MRVIVTQKHIKNGKKGDNESCPIALALMDKGFQGVSVLYKYCYARKTGRLSRSQYRMPVIAKEFIYKFDGDKKVEPFEFNIRKIW